MPSVQASGGSYHARRGTARRSTLAWTQAEAALPLGWQVSGPWRFDELWVRYPKVQPSMTTSAAPASTLGEPAPPFRSPEEACPTERRPAHTERPLQPLPDLAPIYFSTSMGGP